MLRKPKSVLNSSICKLPNLLRPSQQILRQTMGCLLDALLWKSPHEQCLASLIHLLPTQHLPNPRTGALRWLMALGRMGKRAGGGWQAHSRTSAVWKCPFPGTKLWG